MRERPPLPWRPVVFATVVAAAVALALHVVSGQRRFLSVPILWKVLGIGAIVGA